MQFEHVGAALCQLSPAAYRIKAGELRVGVQGDAVSHCKEVPQEPSVPTIDGAVLTGRVDRLKAGAIRVTGTGYFGLDAMIPIVNTLGMHASSGRQHDKVGSHIQRALSLRGVSIFA